MPKNAEIEIRVGQVGMTVPELDAMRPHGSQMAQVAAEQTFPGLKVVHRFGRRAPRFGSHEGAAIEASRAKAMRAQPKPEHIGREDLVISTLGTIQNHIDSEQAAKNTVRASA